MWQALRLYNGKIKPISRLRNNVSTRRYQLIVFVHRQPAFLWAAKSSDITPNLYGRNFGFDGLHIRYKPWFRAQIRTVTPKDNRDRNHGSGNKPENGWCPPRIQRVKHLSCEELQTGWIWRCRERSRIWAYRKRCTENTTWHGASR